MGEKPERDLELERRRALSNLRLLKFLGAAICVGGLVGLYQELGRQETYNSLMRDYIGGPDPQGLFMFVLIAVAGLGMAVWAHLTMRKAGPPEDGPDSDT